MSDIIQMAERLGKAIADSPQAATLRAAREQMNTHGEAMQLLTDYQQHVQKIAKLEQEKKPVEVDDKHKLDKLQTKLLGLDVFKKFTAAQVEYVDLMRKVNDSLRKQLGETEKQ